MMLLKSHHSNSLFASLGFSFGFGFGWFFLCLSHSLFPSFFISQFIRRQTQFIYLFFFYYYFLLTCLTIIHNDRSSENHIYSVSARTHAPIFYISFFCFCFCFLLLNCVFCHVQRELATHSFIQWIYCTACFVCLCMCMFGCASVSSSLCPISSPLFRLSARFENCKI